VVIFGGGGGIIEFRHWAGQIFGDVVVVTVVVTVVVFVVPIRWCRWRMIIVVVFRRFGRSQLHSSLYRFDAWFDVNVTFWGAWMETWIIIGVAVLFVVLVLFIIVCCLARHTFR